MTEQKNRLVSRFAACWKDEALKACFTRRSRSGRTLRSDKPGLSSLPR